MKLELKHLAPYLPYKMKFVIDMYEFTEGNCKSEIRYFTMGNDLSMCLNYGKPILRPLSDLIKEIEIDGKKFIPLVELKYSGTDLNEVRFKEYENCYSVIDNEEHELCFYLMSNSFQKYYRGDYRTNINQIELFNKLFKWHFDIYGLIEQGLAIDINTLKND